MVKDLENSNQPYWQDVENKVIDPEVLKSEFAEGELHFDIGSIKKSRRSFLQIMGFSFTALPLTGCFRIPVKKALPYLHKSDQVVPGVANWYATTMDPMQGCALLVKTREGRPIKIEGNELSPITKGGTLPTCQASVLSLYDSHRYKGPVLDGRDVSWEVIDNHLKAKLGNMDGKEIVLVTSTLSSPSSLRLIDELKSRYSNFSHVVYEPSSMSSILKANKETFGASVYPELRMDQADLVVSFSADFLGTWISPVEYTKQYTSRRDLAKFVNMLEHVHFESIMTLTGSNADRRVTVSPEEESNLIINLLAQLQKMSGNYYLPQGQRLPETNLDLVSNLAKKLWDKQGRSLVISGSQDKHVQVLINAINHLLKNYGKTLVVKENPYFKGPSDNEMLEFVSKAQKGKVGAVLFWDANPLYDYFKGEELLGALKKVEVKVSFASAPEETSKVCTHIMPNNHYLESWNDYFTNSSVLSFAQPVIQPLFGSRMVQESLLKLVGSKKDYYGYLRETSEKNFYKRQNKYLTFNEFWNNSVHNGIVILREKYKEITRFNKTGVSIAFAGLKKIDYKDSTLVSYQKIGIRAGRMANNPWLQELPDPITKVTWDNYFLVSVKKSKALGLKTGDVIKVDSGDYNLSLPVVVQPGVSENVVGVALGYGRKIAGKVATDVGGNAYPFNGTVHGIKISKTVKFKDLALTQTHHSMEGRDIVRETTLKDWKDKPTSGNPPPVKLISLWSKHDQTGHQWAMAIDLNKCTGCSGCIISCNAENNVPVVGRVEVKNRREMHWLRIDRYYKGDDENPEVVHQPVMCQHCDNAPCETVCPVLATVQSSDGLNQQVYNRCVGTRYCGNNCPYKVRRFNWFDYAHDDKYSNMVLNPDVVVRSRGVMEKCSMCIQRIQEGKLQAKIDGRPLKDGEIKMACQQSCPGDAIVFGDINDPKSQISKLLQNARNYRLLEELNVRPRVNYLTKVRNKG